MPFPAVCAWPMVLDEAVRQMVQAGRPASSFEIVPIEVTVFSPAAVTVSMKVSFCSTAGYHLAGLTRRKCAASAREGATEVRRVCRVGAAAGHRPRERRRCRGAVAIDGEGPRADLAVVAALARWLLVFAIPEELLITT